ncbi:MAG: TRAP transporter small permease [Kiritimatiellae bacterium]|nr:TRAP transporter small permease [Kiritimatiellia bacterium]MDD4735235.1 TRAP transporter small permease [Kiritimatiellia bacterium]
MKPSSLIRVLKHADDLACHVGMAVAAMALLFLLGLVSCNVLMRFVGVPLTGAYELAGFSGALIVAFGAAETQRRKGNITVDVITRHFHPVVRQILLLINELVFSLFFSFAGSYILRNALMFKQSGEMSETLKIPFYPMMLCVAGGFFLLVATLFINLLLRLTLLWSHLCKEKP